MARVTTATILCRDARVTICPCGAGDPGPHLLDLEKDMMRMRGTGGDRR